jgi:hypothetical protein
MGIAMGSATAEYNLRLNGAEFDVPLVIGGLSKSTERKLEAGYRLALDRLRSVDSCRSLFAELGADGVEMLSTTIYLPPASDRQRQICARGFPAFTFIGASQTRICDRFGRLSRHAAAISLVHEALHHAGLGEWPLTADGLTPHQINRLVARSCRL